MKKTVRRFILLAMSFLVLGPRGLKTSEFLSLHPRGDFISDQIREDRVHYELINLVKTWLIAKPKSFVDVGANIGNHSHFYSLKGAKVVAFEPVPANFALLEQNLPDGQCHNSAVGSSDEDLEMIAFPNSFGNSHVRGALTLEEDDDGIRVLVESRRLDDSTFESIDLLKIDAEGWEMEVLRGAERSIAKHSPVIWIEIHENATLLRAKAPYNRGDILEWLLRRGYSIKLRLDPTNFLLVFNE